MQAGVASWYGHPFDGRLTADGKIYDMENDVGNAQRPEAKKRRAQLVLQYVNARLIFRDRDQIWRVLVGLQPTVESASALALQLDKEPGPAFVFHGDCTAGANRSSWLSRIVDECQMTRRHQRNAERCDRQQQTVMRKGPVFAGSEALW